MLYSKMLADIDKQLVTMKAKGEDCSQNQEGLHRRPSRRQQKKLEGDGTEHFEDYYYGPDGRLQDSCRKVLRRLGRRAVRRFCCRDPRFFRFEIASRRQTARPEWAFVGYQRQ